MLLLRFTISSSTSLHRVRLLGPLEVCNRPWPLQSQVRWGWLRLLVALSVIGASDIFPLLHVHQQSIELPATTVGEWRRRHSLRRHKGGLWVVHLTSIHRVLLQ